MSEIDQRLEKVTELYLGLGLELRRACADLSTVRLRLEKGIGNLERRVRTAAEQVESSREADPQGSQELATQVALAVNRVERQNSDLSRLLELEAEMNARSRAMNDLTEDFETSKAAVRATMTLVETDRPNEEVLAVLNSALARIDHLLESTD